MTITSSAAPNLFELVEAPSFDASEISASDLEAPFDGTSDGSPAREPTASEDGKHVAAPSMCEDAVEDGLQESDVRLKTDIERVGTTVHGLPLYHFRYTKGPERFEGVMAQDVLGVMPDAVSCGSDGFYRVNYRKLGIEMRAV